MVHTVDLTIGWLWEYDESFVLALEREEQDDRRIHSAMALFPGWHWKRKRVGEKFGF